MSIKSTVRNVLKEARELADTARFAFYGKHPRRGEIAAAYCRLRLREALSKGSHTSIALLGRQVQFADADNFSFVFSEIFIKECYRDCAVSPVTIIDCGSNVGMSILFFKSLWPDARITGIEASSETFAMLKQNVGNLPGVTLVNRAVSDRRGMISFYAGSSSLTASTNAFRGGGKEMRVEAVPLSDFIDGPVDLLKIDIEGGEMAVFAELEASGKLPLIHQLVIEYHHHLQGERGRFSSFLERLERCGFDYDLAAAMSWRPGRFQDILIRARRSALAPIESNASEVSARPEKTCSSPA